MAMATHSPQMYQQPAMHTKDRPILGGIPHVANTPDARTARTAALHDANTQVGRRKSVDFVQQVEVRDYEVEPFDYSDSAVRTGNGAVRICNGAGQASPQLRALTESPTMQPLKPEGPVAPAPSAPKLLKQRPLVRSPHLPPARSPAVSPSSPQSPTPHVHPAWRQAPPPMESPPMESMDAGIAEQRLNLNRQRGHEAPTFEQRQIEQRQVLHLIEEETMRQEVQQLLMSFEERLTSQTPMEVVSVEDILSMWGAPASSVKNAQAPAAPSPYPSNASTTALCKSSKMRLQEAEESLQRLELLQQVSACVPLNFRAKCQLS